MRSPIVLRCDQRPAVGLIFIDTEFTNRTAPELISIGLITEAGDAKLYLESDRIHLDECSPFVKQAVLPLLERDHARPEARMVEEIRQWISGLPGQWGIACDFPGDFELMAELMGKRWPQNLSPTPMAYNESSFTDGARCEAVLAREGYYQNGGRRHHALDDAIANRLGWLAAVECTQHQNTKHPSKESPA